MKKEDNKVFFYVIGLITLIVISPILNGLVIVKLWEWFVSGYFGVKQLTIPVSVGLTIYDGVPELKGKKYKLVIIEDQDGERLVLENVKVTKLPGMQILEAETVENILGEF